MKRAVTNRHKPCPTPERVQQQDNVSPVANYEVHLNTVIRQVNVSASRLSSVHDEADLVSYKKEDMALFEWINNTTGHLVIDYAE